MKGLIWNVSRTNTHRFYAYLFQISPKKEQRIFSSHWGNRSDCFQNSFVDLGKQNDAGKIVATFYDINNEIWKGSRATESLKSGIENTWGGIKARGIKAGENDQLEEFLNASNGLGHDNNEGDDFDNEERFKTLSRVSINNNKRQSQNKNHSLHATRSKTPREQMKEMLNKRQKRKNLTKKLPKGQTSSPTDGTNFGQVLIEKSGQPSTDDTIFRGSHCSCSIKKVFLKFLKNLKENTCIGVSFFIKLQASGL